MLGVTTPAMVAAAANSGILGSLPVGGLSPERVSQLIRETKQKTIRPFAVNLFAHSPAQTFDVAEFNLMQNFLAGLCSVYHIPYERQAPESFRFYYYQDQIKILIQEAVPVVSFTFGLLNAEIINKFKQNGTKLIGTATTVNEAVALANAGVDMICVQGIEAGGHRGTFLDGNLPQVGLISLLPQIADQVDVPLIAAGGIYNKRTMQAAFALGASAVQVGSLFIVADESAASEAYKTEVLAAQDNSTVLTKTFSGRWARGIENEFMRAVQASNLTIPYYTYQNALTSAMRQYAQQHNIKDFIAMWAGQAAGNSKRGNTEQIVSRLIADLPI